MQNLLARLRLAKHVAIFTHQRPDPDALGSQAAAALILRGLGVAEVTILHFAETPPQYGFIQQDAKLPTAMFGEAWLETPAALAIDTILVVDTCTYNQLEPAAAYLKANREKVVAIDHHLSRDDLGPIIYADTAAAAAVEILWQLAQAGGIAMTATLALPLMCGLVADTGWFRFDSVTARTHQMAAELTPHVNNSALYEKLNQMETKPKLGLMQRAMAALRWSANDRFACMMLAQKDFSETGATQSQTEYLVDLPMIVGSVEIVALLTEMPDGKVRGSLRSKRSVDVNKICKQFNGGGHAKAAGARFAGPLDAAYGELNAAVLAALPEI